MVNPILADAKNFIAQFQKEKTGAGLATDSPNGAVTVVHHHYHDGWSSWNPFYRPWCYNPPVFVDCGPRSNKDKKNDMLVFLGVVATAIALVGTYFMGQEVSYLSNASQRLRKIKTQEEELAQNPNQKLKSVVSLHREMVEDVKSAHQTGLAMKAALVASSVAVIGGVLAAAPAAIGAGLLGGGSTAASMLVRSGYSNADTTPREKAGQLHQLIQAAE